MSPQKRSSKKRGWPQHLYEKKGYFYWRHPQTREEYPLGRDKAAAFAEAVEANIHIVKLTHRTRLIHRLSGDGDRTVGAWNVKYQAKLAQPEQKYAAVTLRTYKSLGLRLVRMLGAATPLETVKALAISKMLEDVTAEGHARTAQALRSFTKDSFREAKVAGWYTGENPVGDTKLPAPVEVQRARLSFEDFMAIYRIVKEDWLKNAMALALVSAQRREDIANAQFKDFHDGEWWLEQASEKGAHKQRIRIPLDVRLEVFGMSLGEVVSQCRRSGIVSKYLVHQTKGRGNSALGSQIWLDTLSRRFAFYVKKLGRDWAPKNPPSLHEIRSLAERLYSDQGGIKTQGLLGHRNPGTTALYHDSRGLEWTVVQLGKPVE